VQDRGKNSFLLEQSLGELSFVAFDVETTGLLGFSARIVEIGAVRISRGSVTRDGFWSLVNPQTPIPPEATSVHNIRDDDVRYAPTSVKVLPRFLSWAGEDILVAHNAPYDLEVLLTELARIKVNPPTRLCVDTCAWARMALKAPNYKLATLGKLLSLGDATYHRAKEDALITAFLFCGLAQNFGWERRMEELWLLAPGVVLSTDKMGASAEFELPPELTELGKALEEGADVMMVYAGGTHGLSERRVAPRTILRRGTILYMEAWCYETGQLKTFRIDRIRRLRVID